MAVEAGSAAPDFTLPDTGRAPVTLSELWRARPVLLVFYPFAFSHICEGEICQVRDELAGYTDENVQVVGVSVDTPFTLKAWADRQGLTFPLLSDFWPHGAVAQSYGVFNDQGGMANRGTFLIDGTGTVRFAEVVSPREARDQTRWKKAVAALAG
ncbi:peroxiredoxin [Amycolatopsis kentuckyensis]|uniref:peroxiredoxin n=1 Tax=Amycolatopsis kentuckyensis TaxID=218823 RepID=UPI000A36A057|nr:peroxiredoxin [Amycolatopsis kentuckyensis]